MSWKFLQIEPALARGRLREDLWADPEWMADVKHDGFRFIGQLFNKGARFTTRRVSSVYGVYQERTEQVPHLSMSNVRVGAQAGGVPVPKELEGTVLDCEVILAAGHLAKVRLEGGGVSKAVGSIVTSEPDLAIEKQLERGWLRLAVFDCLWFKGRDVRSLPLRSRREIAADAVARWKNPFVEMTVANFGKDKLAWYRDLVEDGEEGVVLKYLEAPYGIRSAWVKVKEVWTADVVIIGTVAARELSVKKGHVKETLTKYARKGWIGAVRIGQYRSGKLVEVSNPERGVSGFSDELRKEMSDPAVFRKRYEGKVLRIKHNGREPTGRFRHPRWDDLRTDKRARQCTYVEDER